MARYDRLCYINCDIMLLPTFGAAVERVAARFPQFLMVGQRWTLIFSSLDFGPNWDQKLEALVAQRGSPAGLLGIDYFAFVRGLFRDIPPLVIGRIWWDHWLIWRARSLKAPVVDATLTVRSYPSESRLLVPLLAPRAFGKTNRHVETMNWRAENHTVYNR